MIKKWSMSYPAVNGTEQRRAYVYLPTMYEAQPERRFPVLYMFDGQNVFFNEDATYGKSWGVADYLDYTDTPLIVAAIECNAGANNERLVEYSPYRFDDPTYGHFDGKGQATMSWFIHRFKPLIDQNFRTLPDRANTFIGGSSMGGLMSLYALLQYNDTYSRAAALSPSIWVAPDKLSGLVGRAKLAPGTVLYMDYGSREMQPRWHPPTVFCLERQADDPGHPPDQPHRARRHPLRGQLGKTAAFRVPHPAV